MKKSVLFALFVAVASICSGQWLERQVVIGDTLGGISLTGGIVVNPVSGNVYIESRPIQVFNPATLEKMRGPGISGSVVFCPPSGKGYVVRETLLTIDAAADTLIGSTVLPFGPNRFAYSRTSNRLYLGSSGQPDLLVFDPDGDTVLKFVQAAPGVKELLWDSVLNRVYFCRWADATGELEILDCGADTLLTGIRTGLVYTTSLILSTGSHKLYYEGIDSSDTHVVTVINTDSLKVVDILAGLPSFDPSAYNSATDRLYIADESEVYVVDCRSDSTRVIRDVGQEVSVIAPNSLTGRMYLGNYDMPRVTVMDTFDSVVDSISPPTNATDYEVDALTFSPGRKELYGVTDGDKVFVVDASADTVVSAVNYATVTATQIIHSPAGNKLYALCPGQDEVLVFDSTFEVPKHIPGGVYNASGAPVLNLALNRIYVVDGPQLLLIDCNSDSLLGSRGMYGLSNSIPVMVPYLNKLYVFSGAFTGDSVYAYDCLRDTVTSVFYLTDYVTCAVYDPRTNRVLFACHDAPTIRALDPATNSVVMTFDLVGGSYRGRMALNLDLGRLYYTDQTAKRMFTIDLLADSVIGSESLPWNIEAMFINRRLGKLYLCSQDTAKVLVFDCNRGTFVDTIQAGYGYAGLMDERNDKLYLNYGAVVDCRYDSVVIQLDSINPRSMAWDAIGNRVFQATTSRLYVYRDDPYGVEEEPTVPLKRRHATIVRGVLFLPGAENGDSPSERLRPTQRGTVPIFRAALLDISGRKVLDLKPGANDVRMLPAGIYFVRQVAGTQTTKIVIQR